MTTTLSSPAALLLLAAMPAFAAGAAREEVTRTLERTIELAGQPTLHVIHASAGNTRIRTHAGGDVRLLATIRVSAESRKVAEEFSQTIAFVVTETPTRVTVATSHARMDQRFRNVGFAVDLEVALPERTALEASQRFGSLTATGLGTNAVLKNTNGPLVLSDSRGRLRVENRFGPIDVSRVDGHLTIVNSNGVVTADDISGGVDAINDFAPVTLKNIGSAVRVENLNGGIIVHDVRGRARLNTRFGAIDAQNVRGQVIASNSNGSITAAEIDGDAMLTTNFGTITATRVRGSIVAENSNGSIRLAGTTGAVHAVTSFGQVTVRDADGPLNVQASNGGADIGVAPKSASCHPVTVSVQFGQMTMYVGDGGYYLRAATKGGRIRSDVMVFLTGSLPTRNDTALSGTINTGGCVMELTGMNSDITLRNGTGGALPLEQSAPVAPGPPVRAPRSPRSPQPPR